MVKHQLTMLAMAIMPFAFNAQSTTTPATTTNGKVGINTETPTRTLDVNGDLRVRTLERGNLTNSILVAETDGTVKKLHYKGVEAFTGKMSADLVGGDIGDENTEGKFSDNRWKYVKWTGTGTQYAETLSYDTRFIQIKESGFYSVSVTIPAVLDNENNATVGGTLSYAIAKGLLQFSILGENDTRSAMNVAEASQILLKEAIIKKARRSETQPDPNTYGTEGLKRVFLRISGNAYFSKGSYIVVQVHTFGMPGVVSNNQYSNFKFKADQSSIQIYKNL